MTDILVLVLFLLFFLNGWRKGLFRSLITPIFLAIFFIIGIIHFDLTGNLVHTFSIVIIGTSICSLIFKSIFFVGRHQIQKAFRDSTYVISRILGSFVNLFWNGTLLLIALLVLTLTPLSELGNVKKDIVNSNSYNCTHAYLIGRVPVARKIFFTLKILQEFSGPSELAQSEEYKAFFEDPKVEALQSNKEIMHLIESKNIFALLSHPLVKEVIDDNKLMQKLTTLSQKAYQKQAADNK